MKMIDIAFVVFLIAVAVCLLFACGDDNDDGGEEQQTMLECYLGFFAYQETCNPGYPDPIDESLLHPTYYAWECLDHDRIQQQFRACVCVCHRAEECDCLGAWNCARSCFMEWCWTGEGGPYNPEPYNDCRAGVTGAAPD